MRLIIIFALIFSGSAFVALQFDKRIEETFSICIFLIICILYLFGILNLLKVGLYIVIICGTICLFLVCYFLLFKRKYFRNNILTPGFALFVVLFILAWCGQSGRMLVNWDEFTHWGLVVKNMYIFDALGTNPASTTVFRGYPPATALFQYFWVKVSGGFSECDLYRALNILYFSLMVPVFKRDKWNQFKKISVKAIVILVIPLVFYSDFYINLQVDAILGIIFAYALYVYFANEISVFKILNISLALFILTITKASGAGLAFLVILIIAVDLLFMKNYVKREKDINTLKKLIIILCPMLFTLISKYSWSLHLKLTGNNEAWNTSSITLKNIMNLFGNNAASYQIDTIKNFFNALINTSLNNDAFKISYMGWLVLLALVSFIIIKLLCSKDNIYSFIAVTVTLFAGAFIYAASLLILYVFTFTQYEAVKLASFTRYISTYPLGILAFYVMLIMHLEDKAASEEKLKNPLTISILCFLIIIILPIFNITFIRQHSIQHTIEKRTVNESIAKVKRNIKSKNDKVYLILMEDTGYDYWVIHYELTPIKTNKEYTWNIGKPYFTGLVWTADIDVNIWTEELKKEYTYVYILKANNYFKNEFGKIFDGGSASIQDNTLYYINKNNDKIVLQKENLK